MRTNGAASRSAAPASVAAPMSAVLAQQSYDNHLLRMKLSREPSVRGSK